MTEQLSFLPTLDDAEHASWLLNGYGYGYGYGSGDGDGK